jgi:hypothetical protein
MVISQDKEEVRAGSALSQKCEIKQVSLRRAHVSLEGSEESMVGPFSLRLSHHSNASAITDGVLRVGVVYQFQSYDSSETPSLHFSIECEFDAVYLIEDTSYQPSEDSISAFKDGNAIFNTWPYAREFVQSMAARMAVNPPPLPLLRIITTKSPDVKPEQAMPRVHARARVGRPAVAKQLEAAPEPPKAD